MVEKSFDRKLEEIQHNSQSKAFLLVDAKDPDLSWGVSSTGNQRVTNGVRYKSRQEFYEDIRVLVRQAVLDVMLASASTLDQLGRLEHLFDESPITPAVRFNDTTELWTIRGSAYNQQPSRPFATSNLRQAMYGTAYPAPDQQPHVTLGLYSMTFNNRLEEDLQTLQAFKAFREEAETTHGRYFLEIFDPNIKDCGLPPEEVPGFINDHILRDLAGVPMAARPLFLKIVYHGPAAMEELVCSDSSLIVGILGGSSGTTYDAFKLIAEAQKYGARAATFGRKIKNAENPLAFVAMLRQIVDGNISPEEAVKAYHGELQKLAISPVNILEEDLRLTAPNLSYLHHNY